MRKLAEGMIAGLAFALLSANLGYAKLPPPTEEQKKAAEEKKAKDAEADKKGAAALAKAQDQVAERYIQEQKAKGIIVKPTPIPPPAPAAAPGATQPAKTVEAAPEKKK
jgi:uncharacterized protein YqfA (UPF0365 family)